MHTMFVIGDCAWYLDANGIVTSADECYSQIFEGRGVPAVMEGFQENQEFRDSDQKLISRNDRLIC